MLNKILKQSLATILGAIVLVSNVNAKAVSGCGNLENAYGPFDYTNPVHVKNKLPIVEQVHFTFNVESLKKGETGEDPMGDLDYTLRAFPNHHRALNAVMRYENSGKKRSADYFSTECYLKRALAFKPDDGIVWMLYGIYKHKKKEYKDALQYYNKALKLMHDSPDLHYNLGLLYFDMRMYEKSLLHAQKAYSLGYPLPGLKNKLVRKNMWE